MSSSLNPDKALIFRIVHVDNVPWILDQGALHCRNWPAQNPNYVNIGNPDLIERRSHRVVPVPLGGTLSDYVPFYFTPFSMMMYNIKTGYGGIPKRPDAEIVIFVSSIHHLEQLGVKYLFTNQHAYTACAQFYDSIDSLKNLDWELFRSRNFKTSDADPGKQERYQAEALVHRLVPLPGLLGICCRSTAVKTHLDGLIAARGQATVVKVTPSWYF